MRSPFNFVPLSESVFFPDWADDVSHDVPFSDGVSGRIDLTITALSPIFVRNGAARDESEAVDFSHVVDDGGNRRFFIPATSVKGEVRNLLEILSFAKMDVDKRAWFARRDLTPNGKYPLKGMQQQKEIRCGWLRRDADGYVIEDCGKPGRISHAAIDEYVGKPVMRRHFSKGGGFDIEKTQGGLDPKTAVFKYGLVDGVKLDGLTFKDTRRKRPDGQCEFEVDECGDKMGTIVLTGQPSQWESPGSGNRNCGKFYEFVFLEDKDHHRLLNVKQEGMDVFRFLYRDTPEWPRIEASLHGGRGRGVPVFFRRDKNGGVKDLGITFLYKLPYEKGVFESLPDSHKDVLRHDLPQCIFGVAAGAGKDSLRGRVQFGNAFALRAQEGELVSLALATPKASYYPMYVRQDSDPHGKVSAYKDYDDGCLSGWKRYHVRRNLWSTKTGDPKLDTMFRPLLPGATFEGAVYFHNLRPAELGALLSALTFHGSPGAYHQLGLAKPYGYGRCEYGVRLHARPLRGGDGRDAEFYMGCFEALMDEHLKPMRWREADGVRALMAIATTLCPVTPQFQYMVLDCEKGKNEFKEAKDNKECLRPVLDDFGCYAPGPVSLASKECRQVLSWGGKLRAILQKVAEAEDVEQLEAVRRDFAHRLSCMPDSAELFARHCDEKLGQFDRRRQALADSFAKKIGEASDRDVLEVLQRRFATELQGDEARINILLGVCEARLSELKQEDLDGGIAKFIPKITSHKQGVGRVRKWLEVVGGHTLADADADHVISLLSAAPWVYAKEKGCGPTEKQQKDWSEFMTRDKVKALKDKLNVK